MIKAILACVTLLAAGWAAAAPRTDVHAQTVYGNDDRLDLYQSDNATLKSLADSTVALFDGYKIQHEGGIAKLTTNNYGEWGGFCQDEPFFEQPNGAFCSGSLVAPDVIMTAGHCVTSPERCADVKFVFGFSIKESGKMPTQVASADVYGCKELLGREQEADGADWALIRLDRPVV